MGSSREGTGVVGGEIPGGEARRRADSGGFDGGLEGFQGGDVAGESTAVGGGEKEEERDEEEVRLKHDE